MGVDMIGGRVFIQLPVHGPIILLSIELNKVIGIKRTVCLAFHVDRDFLAPAVKLEITGINPADAGSLQIRRV
uniref:hypothetical protein n=1 Tax=Rufibacter glacialis TaxID=1259555 RepID=UPI001CEC7396|nr:hypothetical protein [Rufibacter glacialis]